MDFLRTTTSYAWSQTSARRDCVGSSQSGGMRQRIYKESEALERIEASALQARACRNGPSGVAVLREPLSGYGIEQLPGESLAETVARASGISASELKDLLWERAQAIGD